MSNRRDAALLTDIATAAQRVIAFTDGMDKATFQKDERTHLAVQHQILVIGEAAKRLSPVLRDQMTEIPWSAIARMRDRLIHGYDTVDLDVVSDTVRRGIPDMLQVVEQRLTELQGD